MMAEPVTITIKERLLAVGVQDEFAVRAVRRGLTDEDITWNERLGRPLHWIETVHPDKEKERRDAWQASEDIKAKVAGG